MDKFLISILFVLAIPLGSGCTFRKDSDNVSVCGEVLYSTDKSPLRQAVIYRLSDGKAFLTDSAGNFHIDAQVGDSLRFTFVGTADKILPVLKADTLTVVELDPYIPGNDEYTYNENLFGIYESGDDGSTLKITQADEGKYAISISLFRLTEIDDCTGRLKDGKLIFTGTDASGNPISGEIAVEGDSAKLVFTDSSWEYLPDGTTFLFKRK